ncbi:MAG: lipoyl(octanoyl) transferase LipB [Verrucomicrobiota bacterium]
MTLHVRHLGTDIPFAETLALQETLVTQRLADEIPDTLLLLQHAPVYTIGRTRDQSSLLNRHALPHPTYEISRGGQATYHGPGQLVGYPIIDLKPLGRDLHLFLRALEDSLINLAAHFNVTAQRRQGLTGIWVDDRKLASIGIGVRKWITYHGFALNLTPESLPPFQHITPCGLNGVHMTSLQSESPSPSIYQDSPESLFPDCLQTTLGQQLRT